MVMTYEKDGGLRFPVKYGEIWTAGPITVACFDLALLDVSRLIRVFGHPDLVYCDPPWNAGNARTFRTKAGVDGERGSAVDFDNLISRVWAVVAQSRSGGVVEMGNQKVLAAQELAVHAGIPTEVASGTYYRTKPMKYLVALGERTGAVVAALAGLDDEKAPPVVLGHVLKAKGSTVVDPCTGRGLSAVSAADAGHKFWGVELNPYRVSVTMRKLEDAGLLPHRNGLVRAALRGSWDIEDDFVKTAYWRPSVKPSIHEYIVRELVPEERFLALYDVITGLGSYTEKAFGREYRYFDLNGWKYWTMGAGRSATTIINRARIIGPGRNG